MKKRNRYLHQLAAFQDQPIIKVITGMRGCGKSTLLTLFEDHLRGQGIPEDDIICINCKSPEYAQIKNGQELCRFAQSKIRRKDKVYLILDEIQRVEGWEQAVHTLLMDLDADIYITISNARLVSSVFCTLLLGRYVEIRVLPLSFSEFQEFNPGGQVEDRFREYLRYGSLPMIPELLDRPTNIPDYLTGVYNTVLVEDVLRRGNVRNASQLDNVARYVARNIGRPLSAKKISDHLSGTGCKAAPETIHNYLEMLESAYLLYRVQRYDLNKKMRLKTLEKYYLADTGIRNALLGHCETDVGPFLESAVYLELLRRGYSISAGKANTDEVDFVASKKGRKVCLQVVEIVSDDDARERKLRPLTQIKDNYEKLILSMDGDCVRDFNGIKNVNLIDFLLDESI